MSEDPNGVDDSTESPGEQQELADVAPGDTQTFQERVIGLYNSESLPEVAVGFWIKLIIEAIIVALPLILILVVPGLLLGQLGVVGITLFQVTGIWITVSASILLAVWCFTESTLTESITGEGDSQE